MDIENLIDVIAIGLLDLRSDNIDRETKKKLKIFIMK